MREMKDSGVEWIGEIPVSWDLVQLGSLFSEHKQKNTGMQSENLLSLSYGNIIRKDINTSDGLLPESFEGYNVIDDGDIVLRLTDLQNDQRSLRVGLSHERGIVTSAYVTLRKRNAAINSKFYYYLIHSYDVRKGFYGMGAGVRQGLNYAGVKKIMMTCPPVDEQEAVVSLLDDNLAQVDTLIANVQTQIEKLKAYKQSLITEVVTKGLDPSVPMKDSGVEWIGEIPEHWAWEALKYVNVKIESGVSVNAGAEPAQGEQYGVLKTSSVSKQIFIPTENKNVNEDEYHRVKCPVIHDTLIVSRMNTPDLVGACGYVDRDYPNLFLPDRLWQVHVEKTIKTKYLWYYLISKNVRNYYASLASGTSSSMQNISQGQFESLIILVPTFGEQQSIVEYLDEKCSYIDHLISIKQQKIDKLNDYKKSLIYEYVTGKKEVS